MKNAWLFVWALLTFSTPFQAHSANLIINGDFEDTSAAFVQASSNNGGAGDFATFHTSIGPILGGSWHQDALTSLGDGSILNRGDSFKNSIQIPPGPSSGQNWLYLTNRGDSGSKISQDVTLGSGIFTLSFALATWTIPDLGPVQARVLVQMTDGSHLVLSENFVTSSSLWTTYERAIQIGAPGSYNLSFLVDGDLNFATLDNVQLVPEPESYALILAGLGVAGIAASRRKRP